MAISITEAEYMGSAQAVKVGTTPGSSMPIYTGSQGGLKLLKDSTASIRSKHIDVTHHFAWERMSRQAVVMLWHP